MNKYRGKRIDNGEWVYGYLIGDDVIVGEIVEWDDDYFCTEFWLKVDPETVGQYTGLCDRNGHMIYEGDILSTDLDRPYLVVEYRNGAFMYQCHDSGKDYFDFMGPSDEEVTVEKYNSVIGNVWEHPHLLQEGDSKDA